MKLRIAKTGTTTHTRVDEPTVAAGQTVPSPTIESMIESVREPLNRREIVRQEVEFGNRPVSKPSTPSNAPAPPDLGDAVRKSRS